MNGFRNAIFFVTSLFILLAIGFSFTIGQQIIDGFYITLFEYPTVHQVYQSWVTVRDFFIGVTWNFLVPLTIFLMFTSSFISRNQNILAYIIQTFIVITITPLLIYTFADLISPFISPQLIDTSYIRSLYFENILSILVINMLLSAASFLFTAKSGLREVTA